MDNASKAILMAGGVLIAIAIISVAIFFYTQMTGYASQNEEMLSSTQIQSFNRFYTAYVGRDIRVVDAINILNKALDDGIDTENKLTSLIQRGKTDFKIIDVKKYTESNNYRVTCEYDDVGKIKKVIVGKE